MTKKKVQKPQREVSRRQAARWELEKRRHRVVRIVGLAIIAAVLVLVGAGWYLTQQQPLSQTVIRVNSSSFDMEYFVSMLKIYGKGVPVEYLYGLAGNVAKIIERNELVRQEAAVLGITVSDAEVDKKLKDRDPPLGEEYRDVVRAELLAERVRDEYLDRSVPTAAPQSYLFAMLLESENQAREVRAKLDAGEDFSRLAGGLSVDPYSKEKSGDLGWQVREVLADMLGTPTLADAVFKTGLNTLSQPLADPNVQKSVGYWVLEVLDRQASTGQALVRAILAGSDEQARRVKARLVAGEDFATLAKELSQHPGSAENGGDLGWLARGTMSQAFDKAVFDGDARGLSGPIRDDGTVTPGGYWLYRVTGREDNRQIEPAVRDVLKVKAVNEWAAGLFADPKNTIEEYLDEDTIAFAVRRAAAG